MKHLLSFLLIFFIIFLSATAFPENRDDTELLQKRGVVDVVEGVCVSLKKFKGLIKRIGADVWKKFKGCVKDTKLTALKDLSDVIEEYVNDNRPKRALQIRSPTEEKPEGEEEEKEEEKEKEEVDEEQYYQQEIDDSSWYQQKVDDSIWDQQTVSFQKRDASSDYTCSVLKNFKGLIKKIGKDAWKKFKTCVKNGKLDLLQNLSDVIEEYVEDNRSTRAIKLPAIMSS